MISWSKCRPLNRSCAEVGSVIPVVIAGYRAFQQFAPEPLDDLGRYLEWFEEDGNELFGKLKFHGSISEAFAELQSADDAAICAGAVEHLFHSSEEGQQLERDDEALFESWIIELRQEIGVSSWSNASCHLRERDGQRIAGRGFCAIWTAQPRV
jgi:hypothetical protein